LGNVPVCRSVMDSLVRPAARWIIGSTATSEGDQA